MSRENSRLMVLLRLSREGVGNERTTAERLLKKHLEKANLTIDDLLGNVESISEHFFKYKRNLFKDKELLCQIIDQVIDSPDVNAYTYTHRKTGHVLCKVSVECTAQQAAEISLRQALYRDSLKSELQLTYEAFVQQNRIFSLRSDDDSDAEIDLEALERLLGRMMGMDPTPIHAQIESGSTGK